jgi:hypothetical protein
MLPDFERADGMGEFWGYPESRALAELLIDCEETGRFGRCSSACCGKWQVKRRVDIHPGPEATAARGPAL